MDNNINNFAEFAEIDSFGSMNEKVFVHDGCHVARIKNFSYVPKKERRDGSIAKDYVEIVYMTNEGDVTSKLYSGGIESFTRNAAIQTHGNTRFMKLSETLEYFKTHDITIWTDWDEKFGQRVNYFEPIAK